MISSLKDPIRSKVVLIVILSITSLIIITISQLFFFKVYVGKLETEINNQIAKLEIGELITRNINKSHLEITHLLKSSNPLSFDMYKQKNNEICNQTLKLLSILQNGGEYNYIYRLNLAKRDMGNRIITYKKPADEGIVLEVIDLLPKIMSIKTGFKELLDIQEKISNPEFASEKEHLKKEAIYQEMMLHTLYERAIEDISKIIYEVDKKIYHLKKHKEKIRAINTYVFLLLLSFFSIIIFVVSFLLNKQIKSIQNENKENTERFKAFSEATFEGLFFSENGKIFDMNDKVTDITGYTLKEIQDYSKADIIDEKWKKLITENMESNLELAYDIVATGKDGEKINLEIKGKTFNYKNKLIRVASIKDITARKKAEQELIKSKEKFQSLTEIMKDVVVRISITGELLYVSPSIEQFGGYNYIEEIGNHFSKYLADPTDLQRALELFEEVQKNPKSGTFEFLFKPRKGRPFFVELTYKPLIKSGKTYAVQLILRDITERKQVENKLKTGKERLKMLNKIIRHDLSNDFIAINSAVKIFKLTGDKSMLDEISKKISQSLETIKSYRNYETSIDSNKNLDIIDLKQMFGKIISKFSKVDINIIGNDKVYADDTLNSVFCNLISNSITHGKATKIEIEISSKDTICEIKYSDNGKGISEEIKDKIFEEGFFYGESGHTGMGLHIVKETMSYYNGSISVIDNQKVGAHFLLKLNKVVLPT